MPWAMTDHGSYSADAAIAGVHDLWFVNLTTIPSYSGYSGADPLDRYRALGWLAFEVDGYATVPIPLQFATQLFPTPDPRVGGINLHLETGVVAAVLGLTGGALDVEGDLTIGGRLVMTSTVSQMVPGSTSFAVRNYADSANNLLVSDAGIVSARSTLNALAGVNVGTAAGAGTGQLFTSGNTERYGNTTVLRSSGVLGGSGGGSDVAVHDFTLVDAAETFMIDVAVWGNYNADVARSFGKHKRFIGSLDSNSLSSSATLEDDTAGYASGNVTLGMNAVGSGNGVRIYLDNELVGQTFPYRILIHITAAGGAPVPV